MSSEFEWFERVETADHKIVGMYISKQGNVGMAVGRAGYVITEVDMTYDQAITLSCALSHWAIEKKKRDEEARDVRSQA